MQSGIYKLAWPNCKYFYIGQSVDINKRLVFHKWQLRNNKHPNAKLQRVADKYGMPEIEVSEYCDIHILDSSEQKYLDRHFANKYCCNVSPSSISRRGMITPESTKKKLSDSLRGKKRTPEQVQAMRLKLTGRKNGPRPQYVKDKISKKNAGINNGMFGKKTSEEAKNKIRDKISGVNNYLSKPILNTQTGIFYDTLEDAAKTIGMERRTLWCNIYGLNKKNKTNFIYA